MNNQILISKCGILYFKSKEIACSKKALIRKKKKKTFIRQNKFTHGLNNILGGFTTLE